MNISHSPDSVTEYEINKESGRMLYQLILLRIQLQLSIIDYSRKIR